MKDGEVYTTIYHVGNGHIIKVISLCEYVLSGRVEWEVV